MKVAALKEMLDILIEKWLWESEVVVENPQQDEKASIYTHVSDVNWVYPWFDWSHGLVFLHLKDNGRTHWNA